MTTPIQNPYKPGAGHMPPYLAGREKETQEFLKLLNQTTILENMVLTGLRGVGKTVLLDHFKPYAIERKWLWVGTDLSESASVNEETLAIRILTDLSLITSDIPFKTELKKSLGFNLKNSEIKHTLNYANLIEIFKSIPGLVSDKLKGTLEFVWDCLTSHGYKGIIFAYDEAQTMSDHAKKEQYPLALLLDVFKSIQKKDIPYLLLLTGLPTLFPKLVEVRTFAERMFRVIFLDKLEPDESKDAILKPLQKIKSPINFNSKSVDMIIKETGGYPYFIQFICREAFDVLLQKTQTDETILVPIEEITRKLDTDFFAGRWSRVTDRQRELLYIIAHLPKSHLEFTVQEIVDESKQYDINPFSSSLTNQLLASLNNNGLIYKNRHGKYSFAVPLLNRFILRQDVSIEKKLKT